MAVYVVGYEGVGHDGIYRDGPCRIDNALNEVLSSAGTYPAWVNAAIDDIRPIWNAPQVNVTESNEQETVCILAASIDYIQ